MSGGNGEGAEPIIIGPHHVFLSQTMQPDEIAPIFSDTWTGSQVWHASVVLSRFMFENKDFTFQNKHVIELGSGCGLCGIVATKMGADNTVVTDQPELLSLLQANIERNLPDKVNNGQISVAPLVWGSDDVKGLSRPYDFILIADCINPIYGTSSWENLALTIRELSDSNTVTLLADARRGEGNARESFFGFSRDFLKPTLLYTNTASATDSSTADEQLIVDIYLVQLK